MYNPSSYYDLRLLSLKDSAFLGTYRRKDLESVVASLSKKEGTPVTTDPSRWNMDTPGYGEIYSMWQKANFNPSSIKWVNYYPEKDFEQDLVNDVAFYLRLKGVHRSWISRVDPGYYAPWHWDVDDHEQEYLSKGEIKRYTVFLNLATTGHVLIIGRDYLYDAPWGSIFKWNNYKEWHAGINAGLEPNFMLHVLGY